MKLFCQGLDHQIASVEVRERVAVPSPKLKEAAQSLCALEGIEEAVVLSTCNRTELYLTASKDAAFNQVSDQAKGWFHQLAGSNRELPCYEHSGKAVLTHLFGVASGIQSMVLGETEVFGQVKKAYGEAQGAGATGRILNQVFQKSFQVGKLVRSTTSITRGTTSVGAVGVDLAERIFGNLGSCRVIILGAGEISQRTARSLRSRGAKSIVVSNRSFDKAVELAREMEGDALRFDAWMDQLHSIDIVIGSTAAPHPVLESESLRPYLRLRRGRPLFIIDLSVPRDVAPDVHKLSGVYVYDLDALQRLAEEGKERREKQIEQCHEIITSKVAEFYPTLCGTDSWDGNLGDSLTQI